MQNDSAGSVLSPEELTRIIGVQAEIVRQGQDLGCVMNLVAERLVDLTGAGDAALCELAERLGKASRQSDTVARLGGDEFGIILPEVQDIDSARKHAERVEQAIRQPFRFESLDLELCASIGVALYPVDATDLDVLLHKADEAMYQVKRARKSR